MNPIIIIALIGGVYYMTKRNGGLVKRAKQSKNYINCTNAIFANDEDVLGIINTYIATEQSQEFVNKARILKVFLELKEDLDPSATLNEIDLRDLIYTKNKVDHQKFEYNSDTYVWSMVTLIRAYAKGDLETVNKLDEIINRDAEVVNKNLCIPLYNAISKALKEKDAEALTFLRRVHQGDYAEYAYDKQIIGFYKYLAITTLAYANEVLDEDAIIDLKTFAGMKIGKFVMEDLNIYDIYHEEEASEEAKEAEEELHDEALGSEKEDLLLEVKEELKEVVEEIKEEVKEVIEEVKDED